MADDTGTTLEHAIIDLLRTGLNAYLATQEQQVQAPEVVLETPRNADHGDFACSLALRLAKPLRQKPFQIAQGIVAHLPASELIQEPEVVPPGFINFRLGLGAVSHLIRRVLSEKETFGHSEVFKGHKVLLEFVSANPTGPLHIGHGRGAIIGDSLARIFAAAGYEVSREYYYNDAGVQMRLLGETMRVRYLQALGRDVPMLENGYKGDYMIDLGKQLVGEKGDALAGETDWKPFTDYAAGHIMALIREDLDALRIHFDTYFSETTLHKSGDVKRALDRLRENGHVYTQDGAQWLRTTDFGDEKDRVVIKTDGDYTYLAPDIAYHQNKFERGFDRLINVLGADHHGYIPRLKAAVAYLGYKPEALDCVLVQLVAVERAGEAVKLSTRAGEFITLKEVIDEVGVDVTRFLFLTRAADSQMVFDFELAKQVSMENPVYYVQYAHARCCSLMAKAAENGMTWQGGADADLDLLSAPEERAIVHQMDRFGGVVIDIARTAEPMPMTAYLHDLATAFHAYYSAGSKNDGLRVVLTSNPALTEARLTLIAALRQTLANGLGLLGVTPLERL